ncbi:DUF3592 domain-containing protein [Methylomarinum sp. Ch1-1]|uniref:DUF3592 domain-containing protein n=1 Tax=Methylomarinum roseum TaxID=3067653 RepID=A0AAU7NRE8_9GAMM
MMIRIKAFAYACAFTALSGFLFYTSGSDLFKSLRIAMDGLTTEGRVVKVDRVSKINQPDNFYLVIQFTDHRGRTHRFKNRHPYSYLFAPEADDRVNVRYWRNDTRIATLATVWESFFGPLLSLLMAVFFSWMAVEEYKK